MNTLIKITKQLKFILLAILVIISITFLQAAKKDDELYLKVVYPSINSTIYANSTFFIGSTNPDALLTINNQPVKIWPNGAFVQVVDLKQGNNRFILKSRLNNEQKNLGYFLKSRKFYGSGNTRITAIKPVTAQIINNKSIARLTPDGDRLAPLSKGTKLYLTARYGSNYRFKMGQAGHGWIQAKDIRFSGSKQIPSSQINGIFTRYDDNEFIIKIPLSQKLPVNIEQPSGSEMNLTFYGAQKSFDNFPYTSEDPFIKEMNWTQVYKDTFQLIIRTNSDHFWGYDYGYENNHFVLKLRKPPVIDKNSPLNGKTITLDPGHGGDEKGSVGPTGIPEKDINLKISEYLKEELEKSGARVITTRNTDKFLGLYDRVDIANNNNSQILLSIHNNALPDGKDPYIEHGTSTYYYHNQSLPLAITLQKSMLKELGLKDLGVFNRSFALTRPHKPLAVLVEIGFMIHPEEYMLLTQNEFQRKAAHSLYLGLEEFFRDSK